MECPHCFSLEVVPIVYWLVTQVVRDVSSSGRIVLGGCAIGSFQLWHCKTCKSEWGDPGGEMIDPVMYRLMTGMADPKKPGLTAETLLYIETVEKAIKDNGP